MLGSAAERAGRARGTARTRALAGAGLALVLFAGAVFGADPRIDHIELLGTNLITIHVNTEANRTYTLEYSDRVNSGSWSNLYVIPGEPFANHYVLADYLTNGCRFYRLTA